MAFDDPARAREQIAAYATKEPLSAVVAADDEGVAIAAHAAAALLRTCT